MGYVFKILTCLGEAARSAKLQLVHHIVNEKIIA
jgi:hypothetical protein